MLRKTLSLFAFLYFLMVTVAEAQQAASVLDSPSWNVKIEEVVAFKGKHIPFLKWSQDSYLLENTGFNNSIRFGVVSQKR